MKLIQQLTKQAANPKIKQNKGSILEAAKKSKWNIVRGDTVQIISKTHPEYGKRGIISHVDRKRDRVIVSGVNLAPYHQKPIQNAGLPGRTIVKERSIHYSNVNLIDPVMNVPTRVTRRYLEDGTKVRVAKKSGAIIPRPEILNVRKRSVSAIVTDSCTNSDEDVWEVTYEGNNNDNTRSDNSKSRI
jgi:large subunit ribosomal protein L24